MTVALSLAAGTAGGRVFDAAERMGRQAQAAPQSRSATFDGQALDVAGALARVQQAVVSIDTKVQTRRGPFGLPFSFAHQQAELFHLERPLGNANPPAPSDVARRVEPNPLLTPLSVLRAPATPS